MQTKTKLDVKDTKLRCKDFDEDCKELAKEGSCLQCWLYLLEQGICPYLVENVKE